MSQSEKEDRAVYVPSNTFKHLMSSVFNCYVSLNGQALNLPLDTSTVAHLRTPKSDNLGFTAQFKFFPFQYSVLKIKIFASGVPELEGEAAGTMIIKGVSMESCEHQSYSDESSGAAGSSSSKSISISAIRPGATRPLTYPQHPPSRQCLGSLSNIAPRLRRQKCSPRRS